MEVAIRMKNNIIDFRKYQQIEEPEPAPENAQNIKDYVESLWDGANLSPQWLNGYELGVSAVICCVAFDKLPEHVKNIRVQAVQAYEVTAQCYPEVQIPIDFYNGFITGFSDIYIKNYA